MTRPTMRHALAGLQAGMLGAILLLVWLMIGPLVHGYSAWRVPNLFSTTFFGPDSYRNGFIRATWSGLALILATYSTCGAVWGIVWGERRPPFLTFYGAAAGLVIYFAFAFVWQHLNPTIALYAPTRQLQIAHAIWGMTLARSARYSQKWIENG